MFSCFELIFTWYTTTFHCFVILKVFGSEPPYVHSKRPFGDLVGYNSGLRGNSVLRGVNDRSMSKFDGKTHSLPFLAKFASYLRNSENNEPLIFKANLQLRPIFVTNKPSLFSH